MTGFPTFTIFDTETTGLDPQKGHKIIEIAGVKFKNGTISEESFVSLVNPERDIPYEAKQVNKIEDEDVKNAPTIDLVLPQFLDFAKDTILIAHNARFDMGFLEQEKQHCWGYVELPECLCTMELSRSLYPTEFRHNLDILARRFNLEIPESRHRALSDVMLTAKALERMIEEHNIQDVNDLRTKAGSQMAESY